MRFRLLPVLTLLEVAVVASADVRAQPARDADREQFLLEAQVVRARRAPGAGAITGSLRATLSRGSVTHDAFVQVIDESSPERTPRSTTGLDFRDSWRNDVAAYRLDRLLGLGMVPVTVIRDYNAQRGAFTWGLDNRLMTERERKEKRQEAPDVEAWNRQVHVVRIFDQLIFNFDRSPGNLLIDKSWKLWMTDHTRAFKVFKDLQDEKQLPENCPRRLLAALRKLDEPTLKTRAGGLLSMDQIEGLLGRRDRIVAHYDRLIAAHGEAAVLYDLPVRR